MKIPTGIFCLLYHNGSGSFTTLLSRKVADTVEPLTDAERVNVFVFVASLFERTSC